VVVILEVAGSPEVVNYLWKGRQKTFYVLGEIRDLWAKIYILFDAIPASCRKWLKVGFRKVQRVPIILVPKKNQNIL